MEFPGRSGEDLGVSASEVSGSLSRAIDCLPLRGPAPYHTECTGSRVMAARC